MRRTITIEYDSSNTRPSSVVEQFMHVISDNKYLNSKVTAITYTDGHRHRVGRWHHRQSSDVRFSWESECNDC